jgi:hypothetical protein
MGLFNGKFWKGRSKKTVYAGSAISRPESPADDPNLIRVLDKSGHITSRKQQLPSSASVIQNEALASINHEQLERGLDKYCRIQTMYWQVDVTQSRDFQRMFNGFYRVRRNSEWQEHYYVLLERIKRVDMCFGEVLFALHEATGNVEASFASKLVATRYPERPVIDRFVLENLGMSLPKSHQSDRLERSVRVYEQLEQKYATMLSDPKYVASILSLKQRYPQAVAISDLKALDLLLWQTRS